MELWDNENLLHNFKNVRSVQIDTLNYCNRKCPWCPNSKIEKNPNDLMRWDTLELVLDELATQDFDGRIHPYLNGEPLCDDRIVDIIKLIRKRFPENVIYLSTNGDYLDSKIPLEHLFEAGLTSLHLSDWDQNGKYLKYYGDKRIDLVPKSRVTWWYNRAGNIDVKCNHQFPMCKWVFEKLYINFRGDVILCCSDFYNKFSYGNLIEQSLKDIWLSDLYKKYRVDHFMNKGRSLPLCEDCNRLIGVPNA